jgi:hypothetical protein
MKQRALQPGGMKHVAAARIVRLDNFSTENATFGLAQRVKQTSRIPSDAADVLPGAAVERDSQPFVP